MAIIIPQPAIRNQKPPPGSVPDLGHEQLRDIVGWWAMLEGSGSWIYNIIRDRGHGKFNNIADPSIPISGWNSGKFGKAITVDGVNDYISVIDSEIFNIRNEITIAMWIKPTIAQDSSNHLAVSKSFYQMAFDNSSADWKGSFGIKHSGSTWVAAGAVDINSNVWQHWAGVYDGTDLIVYLDGVEQVRKNIGAVTIDDTSGEDLVFGSHNNGTLFFTGILDDIRIYNRALSKPEINNVAFDSYVSFGNDIILIPLPIGNDLLFSYDINAGEDLLFSYDIDLKNDFPFSYNIESRSDLPFSYDINLGNDFSFSYDINLGNDFSFSYDILLKNDLSFLYDLGIVTNDFSFSYDINARKDFAFSYDINVYNDFPFSYDLEIGNDFAFSYDVYTINDFSFSYDIVDPGALISCDYDTDMIYIHAGLTAVINDSFSSYGVAPKSLTFDGVNLIEADSFLNLIIRHYGISSGVLSTFSAPGFSISGLAWDGVDLISSDLYDNKIYHHDGLSVNMNDSFTAPGVAVTGLTHNGTHLFSCDQTLEMAYIHSGITSTITDSFFAENPSDLAYYNIEN